MPMRARLEALIDEMLDGQIMLDEALEEFEKLYIQKALARHKEHLSRTAATLVAMREAADAWWATGTVAYRPFVEAVIAEAYADVGDIDRGLAAIRDARPDILNHNTETVPRLYRMARSGGRYARTLELLERSRRYAPDIPTKTGLMVGLGEEHDELVSTFRDLRAVDCKVLTIGQYLRPSAAHAPMARYYHPDEFAALAEAGRALGFAHVEAGPLVRSSYHAKRQTQQAAEGDPARAR